MGDRDRPNGRSGHLRPKGGIPDFVTLAGQGALADCGLALVVEVSTNPNITLENPGTTFRVSGRDDRQGPMGAIYAANTLGWTKTRSPTYAGRFGGISERLEAALNAR